MISIENKVIDTVNTGVTAEYSDATVESGYNPTPDSFPFISVTELDNFDPETVQDNLNRELYVQVLYEVNVYANDPLREITAKKIADLVDGIMRGMKFIRISRLQTPNVDRTIYRITMRYRAVVMEGTTANGTTYYQLFHRI